jgi:IclR family transcriptional regulator, KDG regulon repressor
MLSVLSPDRSTVTELAAAADVPVPTAIRILKTMERCGFVRRDTGGSFSHGPAAIRMAVQLDPQGAIGHAIRQAAHEVSDRFNETTAFFMQDRNERVCVASVESSREVRWVCPVGQRMPVHLGAAGRVLVAFGLSDRSSLAPGAADLEVAAIRAMGYATTERESTNDSWGVAAPVYERGTFYGALACGIPVSRATPEVCEQLIDACVSAAASVSDGKSSDHVVRAAVYGSPS